MDFGLARREASEITMTIDGQVLLVGFAAVTSLWIGAEAETRRVAAVEPSNARRMTGRF